MTKTPSLDRLAFMLAMLSAIGPFAIDAYLPAFPQIAATLGATQLQVQQTLAFALGHALHGYARPGRNHLGDILLRHHALAG